MAEYPLLPIPAPDLADRPPGGRGSSNPRLPSRQRQGERLGPVFQRLQDFSRSDRQHELRRDPTAIAPERALVFEVAGSVDAFQRAINQVAGMEWLGDEELEFDADADFAVKDTRRGREGQYREDRPVGGRVYLTMPDLAALGQLLNLWSRYLDGEQAPYGLGPWFDVFRQLRDLRSWGPVDRIPDDTADYLRQEIESKPDAVVRVEFELWSYRSPVRQRRGIANFKEAVRAAGGQIVDSASIPEIAYEAALVDLPAGAVRQIAQREDLQLVFCDDVMFVRPQTTISLPEETEDSDAGGTVSEPPPGDHPPIAALFDGVPVQEHDLLKGRVTLDDPDDLDALSVVSERRHGTAMASLIIHGDRHLAEPPLQRRIYLRPVLYAPDGNADEQPQHDRLLVDTIYRAVRRMREGDQEGEPTAPDVFIVNLSLGDRRRPFAGAISPWARLLDYLADQFGILFLVSAGNISDPLVPRGFNRITDFDNASAQEREKAFVEAMGEQRATRTLLSPAEALNPVTVGAWYEDGNGSSGGYRSGFVFAPYRKSGPNVSSAMGLGHRKAIKPDVFAPGGREQVRVAPAGAVLHAHPAQADRFFGLKAAAPDPQGRADQEGYTSGTSAATALTTRAAHRLFDALVEDDSAILEGMDPAYYGVITKALLVHSALWGEEAKELAKIFGPSDGRRHVERGENVARVLGFGRPTFEEAMICAPNRATLVGCGDVMADGKAKCYRIPLPPSLENVTKPRSVTLTLAWFSPVNVHHRAYRQAKLEIQPDNFKEKVGVDRDRRQPPHLSVPRGSLFHVHYAGERAVQFVDDGHLQFLVFCREQGGALDQSIRYGLAVTIRAGEHVPVYQEVRQALAIQPPTGGTA